jgi:hypothetical protein
MQTWSPRWFAVVSPKQYRCRPARGFDCDGAARAGEAWEGKPDLAPALLPAVPIRRSVRPDHVVVSNADFARKPCAAIAGTARPEHRRLSDTLIRPAPGEWHSHIPERLDQGIKPAHDRGAERSSEASESPLELQRALCGPRQHLRIDLMSKLKSPASRLFLTVK